MKIKHKLLLSFGLIIVLNIVAGLVAYLLISKINEYNYIRTQISTTRLLAKNTAQSVSNILLNDVISESFMRTGRSEHTDKLYESLQEILVILKDPAVLNLVKKEHQMAAKHESLLQNIANIQRYTHALIQELRKRGFRNEGLEGKMRSQVHSLESLSDKIDKADILTLRRHEKDFIIRKDKSYEKKLDEVIAQIKYKLQQNANESQQKEIVTVLTDYQNLFHQIVLLEEKIGFNNQEGMKGEILANIQLLEADLRLFSEELNDGLGAVIRTFSVLFIIIFSVIVLISAAVGVYMTRLISVPIYSLTDAIDAVERGEKNIKKYLKSIKSKDEIGKMAASFSKMYDTLQETLNAESQKSKELQLLLQQNEIRAWRNEGLATLNSILRKHDNNLEQMLDNFLAYLVKYLNCNQGAIFLAENNEDTQETELKLVSSYAYNKKKYEQRTVQIGEGLVGQCYVEQLPIYLTNIPENYITITSGLGHATPSFLAVTPAQFNNRTWAVIELASFDILKEEAIDLINRIAETLAVTLSSWQTTEQTKRLLQKTQSMANDMIAKEETLRQNIEELQAIQEDMERQQLEIKLREVVLESIINSSDDIIMALDQHMRITTFNRACKQRFQKMGIHLEIGTDFMQAMKPENRQKCHELYQRVLKGETFTTYESYQEDDQVYTAQVAYAPIKDAKGNIRGFSIVSKEIKLQDSVSVSHLETELKKSNLFVY